MSKPQYLTKSRFKIGCECPTKLFYLDDKSYANSNNDDSFLKALAEGGFQVGELAKLYFPGGVEITEPDKDKAAQQTADLLSQENAVIFEACFKYENLFVKTDIVVKKGSFVELIEVKSKSYDKEGEGFFKKDGVSLSKAWEPYVLDIAFQVYVFNKSHPKFKYSSSLMLADKRSLASVDGLNQKFLLQKDEKGKTSVKVAPGLSKEDLGAQILVKVNVDDPVKSAWNMRFQEIYGFEDFVQLLSNAAKNKVFIKPKVSGHCKDCEFVTEAGSGLKSGFQNCWKVAAGLKAEDFSKNFIFEIWNYRKKDTLVSAGKFFITDVGEDDISPKANDKKSGLSSSQRQWLQVEKVKNNDITSYVDESALRAEFKSWTFPLHFIDFETTRVAIPFNKCRRPYEQVAFQFSHHKVSEHGEITHQTEYINLEKGKFPNFDFARSLKQALEGDSGTIFRYAAHENTVLCEIRLQLQKSQEPDKADLIKFIESITKGSEKSVDKWKAKREMVDLLELVKSYYYEPSTKGSNSIKKVLPAVLNSSIFLQEKYSKPIYGSDQMKSKNFKNWSWIEMVGGKVSDPYKRLPQLFSDMDLKTMDSLITDDSIADGGAAMTAYSRMQFTEMSEAETARVSKALLQYCELDTLAMVMIYEHWKNELGI